METREKWVRQGPDGKWRMTWRLGIPAVILALFIGALAGWAFDAARGAAPEREQFPVCDNCATVGSASEGVRKFRGGRLGHAKRHHHWSTHNKRVILDNLMQAQRRYNASHRTTSARTFRYGRAGMWHLFTSHDNCYYTWQTTGGSGSGQTKVWSCAKPVAIEDTGKGALSDGEITGIFCGGMAGVQIGAVAASGAATGGWALAVIGVGFVGCMWADALRNSN